MLEMSVRAKILALMLGLRRDLDLTYVTSTTRSPAGSG